jgi:cysteinyl-tRNA synthetase
VLRIYNTLSRRKEPFEPLDPREVRMYVCGPTVYAPAHIGHGMSYVVFDVARRYLEYRGYGVRHVQNFTDVEDKIIRRARETGEPWDQLSARYARDFLRDMRLLNVLPAHEYPRASEVIEPIIRDIERLIEVGGAYPLDGDVYFRVRSATRYGKLSGRKLDELRAGARVEADERKEDPMDFALWKAAKPGEPSWDSPWGPGRPGWHIECTTMNRCALGDQIDLHGGGNDLIFPHHENEIAQTETLTGKEPFSRVWMHNGQLQMDEEKMSKSIGNVLSIPNLVERYGADAFRWFVLSSHYRRPLNFTPEAIESAATAVARVAAAARDDGGERGEGEPEGRRAAFEAAMDDDLNTPVALSVLVELSRDVNRARASGAHAGGAAALLRELAGVLGLALEERAVEGARDIGPFVDLLLEVRGQLRDARQYALADRIRDRLAELHVALEDTPEGVQWRLVR